jgi:hypothetical protein
LTYGEQYRLTTISVELECIVTGNYIDVNGDGLIDYVKNYEDSNGTLYQNTFINKGDRWEEDNTIFSAPPPAMIHLKYKKFNDGSESAMAGVRQPLVMGDYIDVNGDGLIDYVMSCEDMEQNRFFATFINKGDHWEEDTSIFSTPTFVHRLYERFTNSNVLNPVIIGDYIDVNGDNLPDFVRSYENYQGSHNHDVFINKGNRWEVDESIFSLPSFTVREYSLNGGYLRPKTFGDYVDVNGDGLPDFVRSIEHPDGTQTRDTFINKGDRWEVDESVFSAPSPAQIRRDYMDGALLPFEITGDYLDVNGDDLIDYIKNIGNEVATYLNNGSAWVQDTNIFSDPSDAMDFHRSYNIYAYNGNIDFEAYQKGDYLDLNGDGFVDYVRSFRDQYNMQGIIKASINKINQQKPDLLKEVRNGQGGTITVTYEPAPKLDGVITEAYNDSLKLANKSPRYLVTSVTHDDGMSSSFSTSYEYHNGMFQNGYVPDRVNLGFEWIKKTDDTTGEFTLTYYMQDKPYQGSVSIIQKYDAQSNLYLETINVYSYRVDDEINYPDIKFVYKKETVTNNYNGQGGNPITTKLEYAEYDTYGNLTLVKKHGDCYSRVKMSP